jgi:GTP cyclohydrolase I
MDPRKMPDVASPGVASDGAPYAPIDQVGMGDIEVPILLSNTDQVLFRVPARVAAKVSLDRSSSRGIHMSRLYLLVQENLTTHPLTPSLLRKLTDSFLATHQDLSRHAFVEVRFEAPLQRKALKSEYHGWRSYPVTLSVHNTEGVARGFVEVLVTYSSTCPASAALSRQLIQENFSRQFLSQDEIVLEDVRQWLSSTEGMVATPHAQRSEAKVKIELSEVHASFDFEDLIDVLEETLQTPVQGAVKREDEQEFARRNGQNLMFCEDAARRIKAALDLLKDVRGYRIEVKHLESLHPHNAEASIHKGDF